MIDTRFESSGIYRVYSEDRAEFINLVGVSVDELSDGVDYATFFSIIHDFYAHINGKDFSFCRVKIPVDCLTIEANSELRLGSSVEATNIWYDQKKPDRSLLMRSWLWNCEGILRSMGCKNIEDIFRGKKTWDEKSRAYDLFGNGFDKVV